jgi:uncharacterized membrane protein YhaH (DUF805 family)
MTANSQSEENLHPGWVPPSSRGPLEAVRVGLRKKPQFVGRASRSEFWWLFAGQALVYFLFLLTEYFFFIVFGTYPGPLFELLLVLVYLYYQFVLLAASVRRLHDMNFVGWWVLVPLFNPFALMKAGTPGPNRFG